MEAIIAATGPILEINEAECLLKPTLNSNGYSPFRTQNKNRIVDMPIAKVIKLKSFILLKSTEIISIKLCPEELTPRMCFN